MASKFVGLSQQRLKEKRKKKKRIRASNLVRVEGTKNGIDFL